MSSFILDFTVPRSLWPTVSLDGELRMIEITEAFVWGRPVPRTSHPYRKFAGIINAGSRLPQQRIGLWAAYRSNRSRLGLVGYLGVALDVPAVSILPATWYQSVGGADATRPVVDEGCLELLVFG